MYKNLFLDETYELLKTPAFFRHHPTRITHLTQLRKILPLPYHQQ